MSGPTMPFARSLYQEKYCEPNETINSAMNRIVRGLADDAVHEAFLGDIIVNQRFLPGGRIQSSIGSKKDTTAYNCFVSGTIDDSFVDGAGSIMNRLTEASTTMRMGGGIGYDFSTLRPEKAAIKKLLSHSSGPISFMNIYDANGLCCSSAGHRRGAQMGVMRVDHPDIEKFIRCKQPPKEASIILELLDKCDYVDPNWQRLYDALQAMLRYRGFNISVALTDKFMRALTNGDRHFDLSFGGKVYKTVDPQELWEMLMESTWQWAEPGALFIDTINRLNNLNYCEQIAATNPCGEQPLPPHAACLLGSFNLVKYVHHPLGFSARTFNFEQLRDDIPHVVRAMDNVVDRTRYPLREQEAEAQSKRRMGLGVTGLANALEALGHPYGSATFLYLQEKILGFINEECYLASVELAREKGAFPLFDKDKYTQSEFLHRAVSSHTIAMIREYGIRNSHLTSIAPTGTISMIADNVSSSIEPVFAYETERKVNRAQGQVTEVIRDYGVAHFGVKGRRCSEVTVDEHLAVLRTAQAYVDSAVSKTCNVPANTPWGDFKQLYVKAWQAGCKGITTYQVGGRRAGILKSADEDQKKEGSSCTIDVETGRRNCE